VLDRPVTGRCFFEEVIRENLGLGRPDQMPLIFNRRVTRRTPGRFRGRVLTEGVVPSLHVEYKKSKVKQYHKEGQALRTETTGRCARRDVLCAALHPSAPTGQLSPTIGIRAWAARLQSSRRRARRFPRGGQ
jgi:hypothetical protein